MSDKSWGISSNGRAPASHAGGTGIDTRILQIMYRFMRFHHTCYDVIWPRSESTLPVLVRVDILNSDFAPGVAEINYNRLIAPILN